MFCSGNKVESLMMQYEQLTVNYIKDGVCSTLADKYYLIFQVVVFAAVCAAVSGGFIGHAGLGYGGYDGGYEGHGHGDYYVSLYILYSIDFYLE